MISARKHPTNSAAHIPVHVYNNPSRNARHHTLCCAGGAGLLGMLCGMTVLRGASFSASMSLRYSIFSTRTSPSTSWYTYVTTTGPWMSISANVGVGSLRAVVSEAGRRG